MPGQEVVEKFSPQPGHARVNKERGFIARVERTVRAVDDNLSDDARRRPRRGYLFTFRCVIPHIQASRREQWRSRSVKSAFRFELGPCLLVARVPGTAIACRRKYDAVISGTHGP